MYVSPRLLIPSSFACGWRNRQHERIRQCGAVLHALATMVRFVPLPDLLTLAIHLLVTVAKLLRPGGVRAVAAESLVLKHHF